MAVPFQRDSGGLVPHPPLKTYYPDEAHRRQFVSELFDHTAIHYDRIIRLMSLGTGNRYRRQAMLRAGLRPGMRVLDVATGTGPVAAAILDVVGENGSVTGLDRSSRMLEENRKRVGIPTVEADAADIPFPDDSFDFLSMGYALRHVDDLLDTFKEYRRVLKPGGTVLLLELVRPDHPVQLALTRFYMRRMVPLLSRLVTGDRQSQILMEYFWDTIDQCVPASIILDAMAEAGFDQCRDDRDLGIFAAYTGLKAGG